jgi:hypothetical protein
LQMHLPTHGGTPADVTPRLGIDGVALKVEVRRSWPAVSNRLSSTALRHVVLVG